MRWCSVAAVALWLLAIPMADLPGQETAPVAEETAPVAEETAPAAEETAPVAEETAPAAEPGPRKAEFDALFAQWRKLIAELAAVQVRYYKAEEQEKADLGKQWDQAIAQGDAMEPKLIQAAEQAYAESPGADANLTDLLADVVVGDVVTRGRPVPQKDNFARALRIGKLLVQNGYKGPLVLNAAGIAAFVTQDYDTAQEYLKLVKEGNKMPIGGSGQYLDGLVMDFLAAPAICKEAWAKERQIRDAEAKADDLPRVLLKTNRGEIELEMFENEAPNTVANFISLVKSGYYDGLTFHRVLPGFMAQGGCPDGTGRGGPGYNIPCECHQENYRRHFRGSLSMAHAGPDTGGSQFFLTFVPTSSLDGQHTVFGRVVKGMDVLHKIRRRDPQSRLPPEPDTIDEAKVLRDRGHEYQPKKTGE